jgi:hypothetical protein
LLHLLSIGSACPIEPAPPGERLERMVLQGRRAGPTQEPPGSEAPGTVSVTHAVFLRDPEVKAWVLEKAQGVREACGSPGPFRHQMLSHFSRYTMCGHSAKVVPIPPRMLSRCARTATAGFICLQIERRTPTLYLIAFRG